MAAADASLLNDLCTICHSVPKYRCPRCSARTCSLACSTRHKAWAQCSGIRDPAIFLTRNELHTSKAIDQDFNFISGIERNLESADRDAGRRGVQVHKVPCLRRDGFAKGEVNLLKALENCGVIIEKAPEGIIRRTQNKTCWKKPRKGILWTAEWVYDTGAQVRKEIGELLDNQCISEAHKDHFKKMLSEGTTSPSLERNEGLKPQPKRRRKSKGSEAKALSKQEDTQTPEPPRYFYLHLPCPHTPSLATTLLPIPSTATLCSVLRNKIVREYPTIYVLEWTPDHLPGRYRLEGDKATPF